MRKPRSDAALLNLPEEQPAKLADWLLSGVPYHEARARVEKEFGVSLTSLVAFTPFWRRVCVPLSRQRRRRAPASGYAQLRQITPNYAFRLSREKNSPYPPGSRPSSLATGPARREQSAIGNLGPGSPAPIQPN